MAQADGVVANGTGSAVRSDINGQYAALWSNHSGSTEPSSGKVAYQFWADTNTNILKIRNSANNAWISLFTLAGGIDVDAASNFNEDVTFVGDSSKNAVWDKSDGALEFADNAKCTFGAGDLAIYHDGNHSYVEDTGTGDLRLKGSTIRFRSTTGESMIGAFENGAVELYQNNFRCFSTNTNGITLYGPEGGLAQLELYADEGDDNADKWRILSNTNGNFHLQNHTSGSWENTILATGNGTTELYFDNSKKFSTLSDGCNVDGHLYQGDGEAHYWGAGNDFTIWHDSTDCRIRYNHTVGSLKFQKNDNSNVGYFDTSGDFFVQRIYDNTTSGGANVRVQSNGLLQRDTSSRRYKNTIEDATHGLADLNKLRSVTYKGNNDGDTIFGGLIAEEVHDAGLTEFVDYNSDNQPDALRYANMVSLCIKAIQELSEKIAVLEAK